MDKLHHTLTQDPPSLVYYRKRGSASYIVREVLSVRERERYRERDGSDVTNVALKLAMNLHLSDPLPKIRTIGDEVTLSLAKIRTFLPSHFPSLPSRKGHHCGAEVRNESTRALSIAKHFFALFVPPLSNGTSSDE